MFIWLAFSISCHLEPIPVITESCLLVFHWSLSVGALAKGKCLTSHNNTLSSLLDIILGHQDLAWYFAIVLDVFLFLTRDDSMMISSFLPIALHDIPPFFMPIILHLSSIDSLCLAISPKSNQSMCAVQDISEYRPQQQSYIQMCMTSLLSCVMLHICFMHMYWLPLKFIYEAMLCHHYTWISSIHFCSSIDFEGIWLKWCLTLFSKYISLVYKLK